MRWLFLMLVIAHGLIHFLGFAKAFGLAELPQLTTPISRPMGMAWLGAGLALLATGALFIAGSRIWPLLGLAGAGLSQVVLVSAWSDAKFGTVANLLILATVGLVVARGR